MKHNLLFKLLASIPVILLALYYIPFLGICLILFRYFVYKDRKYYSTPLWLFISAIVIILPKGINLLIETFKISVTIPYLNTIINSNVYTNLLEYTKLLITVSIIFLIISYVLKHVFTTLYNKFIQFINEEQKKDYEISQKNDLLIKEKQQRSKDTRVVNCPNCGADNMLSTKTGKCKYCRSDIE